MTSKQRKTLVQLQQEQGVTDPLAQAKSQLREIENTALKSQERRRQKEEESERARTELEHTERQIALIESRYKELCGHLEYSRREREALAKAMDEGKLGAMQILAVTKDSIRSQNFRIAKLTRSQARLELQQNRGYSVGPSSTFRQGR